MMSQSTEIILIVRVMMWIYFHVYVSDLSYLAHSLVLDSYRNKWKTFTKPFVGLKYFRFWPKEKEISYTNNLLGTNTQLLVYTSLISIKSIVLVLQTNIVVLTSHYFTKKDERKSLISFSCLQTYKVNAFVKFTEKLS